MRIAIVDDDPVEKMLLTEIAAEIDKTLEIEGFATVDSFVSADVNAYELVFLDRRIPPYNEFSDTLPKIVEAGFQGRIVLMTAFDPGIDVANYPFKVEGPFDKLELLDEDKLAQTIRG